MKPFLILQLRPETDASDDEYRAILDKTRLLPEQTLRIRVDREMIPADLDIADFSGTIVGGGPACVSDPADEKSATDQRIENQISQLMPRIIAEDRPFMGCCYGLGILAHHLGGEVSKARYSEPVGPAVCTRVDGAESDPLLAGLPSRFEVFVGHKEAVQSLPAGCTHLLSSESCPIQMIRYGRNVYATQFHPEADAKDFESRIRIYQNHGYFPPEDADTLISSCYGADVYVPGEILQRFTEHYD